MRTLLLLCAAVLFSATACFGTDAATTPARSNIPRTSVRRLTIVYSRTELRNRKIVVAHARPLTLRCDPSSGDLPHPAAACQAIEADPARFFRRASTSCIGGILRWSVRINGVVAGRSIRRTYDMCDYPEARAWTDLGGTSLVGIVPAGSPEAAAGPKNH